MKTKLYIRQSGVETCARAWPFLASESLFWEYTEHEKGKIDQNDFGDMPIHGAVKFRNVVERAFG
jgi:hypothetical protein